MPRREATLTRWTLHHGDALSILPTLPTRSVDTVIADPPYSSGGMLRGDRAQPVHTKYVQSDSWSGHQLAEFTGDNRDQRGYLAWSTMWLSECRRLLAPGGVCAVFCDWRQLPITTDALQAAGFVWRGIVPWCKPNGRRTQGRYANSCEYLAWGTNGPRPLDAIPGALPGYYVQSTPPSKDRLHITEKPLALMRELVKIAPPDGLVLDPFAGSGATGHAALEEGRRFVGVELSDHYAQVTRDRLDAFLRQPPLPL